MEENVSRTCCQENRITCTNVPYVSFCFNFFFFDFKIHFISIVIHIFLVKKSTIKLKTMTHMRCLTGVCPSMIFSNLEGMTEL